MHTHRDVWVVPFRYHYVIIQLVIQRPAYSAYMPVIIGLQMKRLYLCILDTEAEVCKRGDCVKVRINIRTPHQRRAQGKSLANKKLLRHCYMYEYYIYIYPRIDAASAIGQWFPENHKCPTRCEICLHHLRYFCTHLGQISRCIVLCTVLGKECIMHHAVCGVIGDPRWTVDPIDCQKWPTNICIWGKRWYIIGTLIRICCIVAVLLPQRNISVCAHLKEANVQWLFVIKLQTTGQVRNAFF